MSRHRNHIHDGLNRFFFRMDDAPTVPVRIRGPVLAWLLAGQVVLVVVFFLSVCWMYWQQNRSAYRQLIHAVQQDLPNHEKREAAFLETLLNSVADSERYQAHFLAGDRDALWQAVLPLYQRLHTTHFITHFDFYGWDRTPFLRVHDPTDDRIVLDRRTLRKAEETGKTAYGVELGRLGLLALHVVVPWHRQGQRIGYLAFEKPFRHLLDRHHAVFPLNFYAFAWKKHMEKEGWERGGGLKERCGVWEQYAEFVCVGGTTASPPPGLVRFASYTRTRKPSVVLDALEMLKVFDGGAFDRFFDVPLHDVDGRSIGFLVATYHHAVWDRLTRTHIATVLMAFFGVASLLMLFFQLMLGRVERRVVQAGAALRESEARFRAILDNTVAVIFVKDREGRYLLVNKYFSTLFHVSNAEIVGRTDFDLFPEGMAQQFQKNDRTVLERGEAIEVEERVPQDDGMHTYIVMKFPLLNYQGHVCAVCGIATDITQRTHMEAQLMVAKEKAEKANRAKSDFLATMSHEIRTPLNAILGLNEHLLETETRPERIHYLELAKKGGEELLVLVNNVLDLSKIEAQRLVLERVPLHLPDLIHTTMKMVSKQAHAKGLKLAVHMAPDLPVVALGDPQRLAQVFLNLVGNAVKFTHTGQVTVSAKRSGQDEIHCTVSDTGIGIPEASQARIFQPFTQVDSSTTRRFGGTGLGLDICQRLVEAMEGVIWLESEEGRGSHFHFTCQLPESTEEIRLPERRTETRLPVVATMTPQRILLAEDVEENATILQLFLEDTPHRMDWVEDGQQAVARFRTGQYDLVLMDIQMPVMDGLTATRAIRAWERDVSRARTPVCALTAHAMQEIADKSRAAGCCMHLTKPISKRRLLNVIQHWARERERVSDVAPQGMIPLPSMVPLAPPLSRQRAPALAALSVEGARADGEGDRPPDTLNTVMLAGLLEGLANNHAPLTLFLQRLPQRLSHLADAVAAHAPARLGSEAHKLKGAARMFGANRLAALSFELEQMGKRGQLPENGRWLEEMQQECGRLESAMIAYLETMKVKTVGSADTRQGPTEGNHLLGPPNVNNNDESQNGLSLDDRSRSEV